MHVSTPATGRFPFAFSSLLFSLLRFVHRRIFTHGLSNRTTSTRNKNNKKRQSDPLRQKRHANKSKKKERETHQAAVQYAVAIHCTSARCSALLCFALPRRIFSTELLDLVNGEQRSGNCKRRMANCCSIGIARATTHTQYGRTPQRTTHLNAVVELTVRVAPREKTTVACVVVPPAQQLSSSVLVLPSRSFFSSFSIPPHPSGSPPPQRAAPFIQRKKSCSCLVSLPMRSPIRERFASFQMGLIIALALVLAHAHAHAHGHETHVAAAHTAAAISRRKNCDIHIFVFVHRPDETRTGSELHQTRSRFSRDARRRTGAIA